MNAHEVDELVASLGDAAECLFPWELTTPPTREDEYARVLAARVADGRTWLSCPRSGLLPLVETSTDPFEGLAAELAPLGMVGASWSYLPETTLSGGNGGSCTTSAKNVGPVPTVPRTRLTQSEVMHLVQSVNHRERGTLPGSASPALLERWADDLLDAAGFDHSHQTAWEDRNQSLEAEGFKHHLSPVVRPDRVAFRGQARFAQRNASYDRPEPIIVVDSVGQAVKVDRVLPCEVLLPGDGTAVTRYRTYRHGRTTDHVAVPSGTFTGHAFTASEAKRKTISKAEAKKVAKVRAKAVKVGAGTRGPVTSPWLVSDRNLRARWAGATPTQLARCEYVATVITTTAPGMVLVDGAPLKVEGGKVHHAGHTFTVQSFARRATLAGLAID